MKAMVTWAVVVSPFSVVCHELLLLSLKTVPVLFVGVSVIV